MSCYVELDWSKNDPSSVRLNDASQSLRVCRYVCISASKIVGKPGHVWICLYPTTIHMEAEVRKNEPTMMGHGALFQSTINDVQ